MGSTLIQVAAPAGIEVRFTGRGEGDLRGGNGVEARRAAIADVPWTVLCQVHGSRVVTVTEPGQWTGAEADGAVTAEAGCALAVLTADCGPVALVSEEGVLGVAHAGWRGLAAGIVENTVAAMRALGAGEITAVVGPSIRAECYEFGARDLDEVATRLGDVVRGRTSTGAAALDLAAGVRLALEQAGVALVADLGVCTACTTGWYSHRAREEVERQAVVAWR